MFYKLILQNHVEGLSETQWTFRTPAVVGREPDCDVCIDHESISRKHCHFSLNGEGALVVKDNDSTNGIYVMDSRVRTATLMPHQSLQIGSVIMTVEFTDESEVKMKEIKPQGSVYSTQPMATLSPPKPPEPEKPWWRKIFE